MYSDYDALRCGCSLYLQLSTVLAVVCSGRWRWAPSACSGRVHFAPPRVAMRAVTITIATCSFSFRSFEQQRYKYLGYDCYPSSVDVAECISGAAYITQAIHEVLCSSPRGLDDATGVDPVRVPGSRASHNFGRERRHWIGPPRKLID